MATDLILTSGGLQWMRDCLAASSRDVMPQPPAFIALSSGTVPVGRYMATLPGETFRAPIVSRDPVETTVSFRAFLATDENNNQTVGRYGIFGGDNVEAAIGGGGTLIAVANESTPFSKTATKTLSVSLAITVSGSLS